MHWNLFALMCLLQYSTKLNYIVSKNCSNFNPQMRTNIASIQFLQSRTLFSSPYQKVLKFISTHYAPSPTNVRMYFTQENAQK